jgi:hypothetical protein
MYGISFNKKTVGIKTYLKNGLTQNPFRNSNLLSNNNLSDFHEMR